MHHTFVYSHDVLALQDLLQYNDTIEAWQSTYAINAYIPEVLNGTPTFSLINVISVVSAF